MKKHTIYFDMDGTIADLYGYDNWLEKVRCKSTEPYLNAKPLVHMPTFARVCNQLKNIGYSIGIISWTAKGGTADYNKEVAYAKAKWLACHLPSVKFDEIIICDYGTPKSNFASDGDILFDDEENNLDNWADCGYLGFSPIDLISTLINLKNLTVAFSFTP